MKRYLSVNVSTCANGELEIMKIQSCYKLAPNRVWRTYLGGKTLDQISGIENPSDTHFPEDWLVSTTAARNIGREEVVDEGIAKVITKDGVFLLTELFERFPEDFFGTKHLAAFGKSPEFLLKYLDSSIRLHMQCHPTVEFARQHLHSNHGKTEGYYILGVRPGCEGYIYLGFQRAPEPADFRQAVEQQDSEKILSGFDKIKVKAGDCFIVPGGIPHAIGEGVFMVEIMEPSDFAVRVEFERGGYVLPEAARFMGRDIAWGLSMFDFTSRSIQETRQQFFIEPSPLPLTGDGERFSLFDDRKTSCFRAEFLRCRSQVSVEHESLRAVIVTAGSGKIICGNECFEIQQYDRLLIPAMQKQIFFSGNMELLTVLPPSC